MTTLDRLFKVIDVWQTNTFGDGPALGAARHLAEEVVEVTLLLEQRKHDPAALAEELADVFFLWVQLVTRSGHRSDIAQAIEDKLTKNVARRWQRPDADGVVRHVKGDDNV